MTTTELLKELDTILAREGYGTYFAAVKIQTKRRLQIDKGSRPARIKFPPAMYQRLFDRQKGICPECQTLLDIPAKKGEIDHVDPNRQDFNHPSNLALLHRSCNREKSAMTIQEQSKAGHGTFEKILRTPVEEPI